MEWWGDWVMGYWGIGVLRRMILHGCMDAGCGFNVYGRGDLAPTLTRDSTPIMSWKIVPF
jgi:hypothetical protein